MVFDDYLDEQPQGSEPNGGQAEPRKGSYWLAAVVCHYGNVHGGHYVTMTRKSGLSPWYRYDDDLVTKFAGDLQHESSSIYMLAYIKEDSTPSVAIHRLASP